MKCTYQNREGLCDGNDGDPCDDCAKREQAEALYWKRYFGIYGGEQSREEYEAEMRDAGRGHLVPRE